MQYNNYEIYLEQRWLFILRCLCFGNSSMLVVTTEGNPWCETKEVRSVEIVK
jgi:hypothetical protein